MLLCLMVRLLVLVATSVSLALVHSPPPLVPPHNNRVGHRARRRRRQLHLRLRTKEDGDTRRHRHLLQDTKVPVVMNKGPGVEDVCREEEEGDRSHTKVSQ